MLDPLRELDLLGRGQQRVPAGLVEEELQRVRRHHREVAVDVRRLLDPRVGAVVRQLDAALLELLVDRGDRVVLELELLYELAEGGEIDAATLLALVDQHFELVRAHTIRYSPLS